MHYFKEKRIDYDSTLLIHLAHLPVLNPVDHQKTLPRVVLFSISFAYFETIFSPENWAYFANPDLGWLGLSSKG